MPPPAGQARPETLFAPIVERRFLVAGFFVGVVARGAGKTICWRSGRSRSQPSPLCHIIGLYLTLSAVPHGETR
ncbi:MAG: hypothetical protein JWO19_920 [Bryobacterales bacterium]|nr:hypothetical protein [Bryobacterales bacterium]